MISGYQDGDENDFKFDDETLEDDKKRMVLSQFDIN